MYAISDTTSIAVSVAWLDAIFDAEEEHSADEKKPADSFFHDIDFLESTPPTTFPGPPQPLQVRKTYDTSDYFIIYES